MRTKTKTALARPAPPAWLVNVVWLVGFFLVWEAIALAFDLTGQKMCIRDRILLLLLR